MNDILKRQVIKFQLFWQHVFYCKNLMLKISQKFGQRSIAIIVTHLFHNSKKINYLPQKKAKSLDFFAMIKNRN